MIPAGNQASDKTKSDTFEILKGPFFSTLDQKLLKHSTFSHICVLESLTAGLIHTYIDAYFL